MIALPPMLLTVEDLAALVGIPSGMMGKLVTEAELCSPVTTDF